MKIHHLGYALLVALPLAACKGKEAASAETADGTTVVAKSSEPVVKYPAKSGIIEWKNNMAGEMITTLYFDEAGAKKATYTTTTIEIMRQKHTSRSVEIEVDGWVISYDPDTKTGTRRKAFSVGSLGSVPSMPSIPELPKDVTDMPELEELEPRTYFGKEAHGYAMEAMGMKIKSWVWENIPMRTEMDMGGTEPAIMEVIRLELGTPVPADKFVVPTDVVITDQ